MGVTKAEKLDPENASADVNDLASQALRRKMIEGALTLVRNEDQLVPFGDPDQAEFKNLSDTPIQVYWLDFKGHRQARGELLKKGESYFCKRTFNGHAWLVADEEGQGLGIYVAGKQNARVVFRRPKSDKN